MRGSSPRMTKLKEQRSFLGVASANAQKPESTCDSTAERQCRFQFCIERFQSIRHLFLQLRHSCGSSAGAAHGQPARVPDLVGSRLPSPYQFRARIQSFQAVAAPFPGDSVLPAAPRAATSATAAFWRLVEFQELHEIRIHLVYNLNFLLPLEIAEATSQDASTYLAFPKDKSRKRRTPPRVR